MRRDGGVMGALATGILCVLFFMAGCARPPTDELAKAEKALENARAKEADIYLEEGYRKADAALKKAKDLIAQKDYKGAKAAAQEASSNAQLLSSRVDAAKSRMKTDADQMLQEMKEQTNELKIIFAEAVKKKLLINRDEARDLIGKNEIDLINVKVRLETGKIRQGYDDLKIMTSQTKAQKEKLAAALAPVPDKN